MDLRLNWCSIGSAQYAATHWHYAKNAFSSSVTIGVWEDSRFIGAIIFGRGANRNIGKPYTLEVTEVCELTRVALRDHVSPVSQMLAIAVKMIAKQSPGLRLIVSYADDEGQGHHGGIYQAAGWIYVGRADAGGSGKLIVDGKIIHGRTLGKRRASSSFVYQRAESSTGKHKYLFPIDRSLLPCLKQLAQPYPKRERSRVIAAVPPSTEDGVIPIRSLHNALWSDEELEQSKSIVFLPVDISTQLRLDQLSPKENVDNISPLLFNEPQEPIQRLSALDFVNSLKRPISEPMQFPKTESVLQTSSVLDAPTQPGKASKPDPATDLRAWLAARGYRVLRAGETFVLENPDAWTAEDFATFCNLDAALVMSVAENSDGIKQVEASNQSTTQATITSKAPEYDGGSGARSSTSERAENTGQTLEAPSPYEATRVDPSVGESGVSQADGEAPSTGIGQEATSLSQDPATLVDDVACDLSCQSAGLPGEDVSPAQDNGDRAGVSRPSVHDAERMSPSLFEVDAPPQTLAQFLGSKPSHTPYTPDEPPDLAGINEIVLNFATDGLDWVGDHRPVGLTVSSMDGQLCRFLPFRFAGGNLDEGQVKRWAQEQLRDKKIYNSKTKFDLHMARVWGVDLEAQGCTFSDIQHTAALLDDHRKRFAIDVLAADYLPGLPAIARVDESRHHEHHAADVAERERYTASLVWRLKEAMYPQLKAEELEEVQALEDAVIPTVVEMEKNGSPIDMALLEQYGRECEVEHGRLMMDISREVGFAFEHTASGWKRLIEALGLTPPDSFAEASLNEIDHPLIRKGQRAAQYASLNSKIFKAYPNHIRDGILRYDINQLVSDEGGTVSGRFSIGVVQQVPNAGNHQAAFGDELFPRRLFVPGQGDYLEADAAQIEFRLLVHYTQNARLLQAYKDDPTMSFHKEMQKELQIYKPDMIYEHTKSYNFAAQYGARSIKLAVMMGFITEREGNAIRQAKNWDDPRLKLIKEIEAAYRRAHPEASALLDKAAHLAKSSCDEYCKKGDALHRQYEHRGYIKTLDGRRSRFPTNYKTYVALNRCLQGSGASIMKRKLVELHAERKHTGFVMRITNHDAVLGDATMPETAGKVAAILDRQSYPLKVPIIWQVGTGRSWADCK